MNSDIKPKCPLLKTNELSRPSIEDITDDKVFTDWYWLKSELMSFCRNNRLSSSGSKESLTRRISDFKAGRHPQRKPSKPCPTLKSEFNWGKSEINKKTVITPNYKNTQNVRAFFYSAIGKHFRFNIEFMDWMKSNHGKTMEEAVLHWLHIEMQRKNGVRSEIPKSNQFNRFVRDYFDNNPNGSMDEARAQWKKIRNIPGPNRYKLV